MKILFVCDKWGALGGKEQETFDFIEGLKAMGHTCLLVYSELTNKPWDEKLAEDISMNCIPGLNEYRTKHDKCNTDALSKILDQEAPDVVFITDIMNFQMLKLLIDYHRVVAIAHNCKLFCLRESKILYFSRKQCGRNLGVGCLLHGCFLKKQPGPIHRRLRYNSLTKLLRLVNMYRQITRHLVHSNYMREIFLQHGFRPEQVDVLWTYMELPPTPGRNALNGTPNILFLGRIDRYKGVDYLLKALARLSCRFTCTVVGDGPYLRASQRLCRRLGLEQMVTFVGWKPNELTTEYLQDTSVAVVPSIWPEPFGRVGIEAMASAKPVVAFHSGGISDWLQNERTGYLVPARDVDGLARKIEDLLQNPERALEFGLEGRRVVETKFSKEAFFKRLIRVFEEVSRKNGNG